MVTRRLDVLTSCRELYICTSQYCHELKRQLQQAYGRVREYSRKEQLHQKDVYDRRVKGDPYRVNDMVFLLCPGICHVNFTNPGKSSEDYWTNSVQNSRLYKSQEEKGSPL